MDDISIVPGGLFAQPWWLDAVAGQGNWGECRVESGGRLMARMPYVTRKRFGFTFLDMPPLTPFLGPWFQPSNGKVAQALAQEMDFAEALIAQLPAHSYFRQGFRPEVFNSLPWYWQGFHRTVRYTYALEDLADEKKIWDGFQTKVRTDVRKAERSGVQIRTDLTLEDFLKVHRMTFTRQGLGLPVGESVIRRLDQACELHQARKIFFAVGPDGCIHAVVYLVWDQDRAYYLMGGGDPALRNSGATSLALWQAIRFAATVSKVFDFEGSMMEPVERFVRGFGARQIPYLELWRASSMVLTVVRHGRAALRDVLRSKKQGKGRGK